MSVIDKLIMNQEALETAITNYENKKMGMENTYLKISNEVRTLDGTWHGEASEKFKASFDGLYKNISQTETVMTNVIDNLKKALATYEQAEEEAKGLINALDTGTAYQANL